MNMFKPVDATTIEEYFNILPPDRRTQLELLHKFIIKTVPSLKPTFAKNMIGYGSFQYKNSKKELLDWPIIGLASMKNHMTLHICAIYKNMSIIEEHKDTLGKVTIGKGCISFKNLDDVDLETLKIVLKFAEKFPGFGGI